jgi:hypothetical protein
MALLAADLNNLGLTPQATLCRPFGAPERRTYDVMGKGGPENEHLRRRIDQRLLVTSHLRIFVKHKGEEFRI